MAGEQQPRPLTPAEFTPLDAAASRRRFRVSPVYLGLGIVAALAALSLTYLLVARAVIFNLDPVDATLDVSGISFHIGDNFLLLPGRHEVMAEADGYYSLTTTVDVSTDRTQEIQLALEPLPGKLRVDSALDEIEVIIDGEAAGIGPGIIEGVPRGPHIVEFRKHRYFPLRQEIEIEGLATPFQQDLDSAEAAASTLAARLATGRENVRVAEARAHPTWHMGPKLTVASATLKRKGP